MSGASEPVASATRNLKTFEACPNLHTSYDSHDLCTSCRQKEGRSVCTRDDNCEFCLGCDDILLYEKNLAIKEKRKQKIEKLQCSQSVLSEEYVSVHPEENEETSLYDSEKCGEEIHQTKYVMKVTAKKRKSPAPWDADHESSSRGKKSRMDTS